MLHQGMVRNYLHLARTEMFNHLEAFDTAPLTPLVEANRVSALYVSEGDEWAPLAMERRLAEEAGVPTTVLSGDDVGHQFSCNAQQTAKVAEWVAEAVRAR